MFRFVISALMAIHAVIHLIGFVKKQEPASDETSGPKQIARFSERRIHHMRALWLMACILLLTATYFYFQHHAWFWLPATVGMVLSQLLIVLHWSEAKWGTWLNLIVLLAVIFSLANLRFQSMIDQEIDQLHHSAAPVVHHISAEQLSALPPVVQKWLTQTQVPGRDFSNTTHVVQHGIMRTSQQGQWMPFEAEQYFTLDPPAFVWSANIQANAFVDIAGRDKWQDCNGSMRIKAASLLPIANSSGTEIDQGSMIRYMAELIWFPHGAASPLFTWEQTDTDKARITMTCHAKVASGLYTFNADGLPIRFEAQRWGEFEGAFRKETWSVAITHYKHFNGISMPDKSEVTWKLKEGDFTWLKLEVVEITN